MEPTLSEIRMFAVNFAPRDWAPCNGQLLPIAANSALFSLIGTTYGGDGQSNFALPQLAGVSNLGRPATVGYYICMAGRLPVRG